MSVILVCLPLEPRFSWGKRGAESLFLMKLNYYFLLLILFIFAFLTYKFTYSYFSDSATLSNNILSASETFPTLTPTHTPTPQIANHIVISEVQIDGGVNEANDYDFIELYNPTSSPESLNGLRLVKRTKNSDSDTTIFTFTSSHRINPHSYFLWGHKSSGNNFADSIFADISSSDTLATDNSIALKNVSSGKIIDALSWDSSSLSYKETTEFSPDPGVNKSMERKALSGSTVDSMDLEGNDEFKGNGYDSGDNSTDFILRSLSQPQYSTSSAELP